MTPITNKQQNNNEIGGQITHRWPLQVLLHQLLQTVGQLLVLTHTTMDALPIDAAVATIHHLCVAPFCGECDVVLNEKLHFEVQFCEILRNAQN